MPNAERGECLGPRAPREEHEHPEMPGNARYAHRLGLGEQALLDALEEALIVVDPAGAVVRWNSRAQQWFGHLDSGGTIAGSGPPALFEAIRAGRDSFVTEHTGSRMTGRKAALPDGSAVWLIRDVTAERAREDALLEDRRRWSFVVRTSRVLSGTLNLRRTAELAARLTVDGLAGQCGLTLRTAAGPAETAVASAAGPTVRYAVGEPPGAGPQRVLDTGRPEQHSGLTPDEARALCPPGITDPAGRESTVLLLPLSARGACFGVMTLVRDEPYGTADLAVARDHADRVALALDAARLYHDEMRIAERLRSALLPAEPPVIPGVRLGTAYRASERGALIGGDFYDVLPLPGGAWQIALGDVSGKGIDAAVYTGRVRQTLNAAVTLGATPIETLDLLNRTLLMSQDEGRFVTLVTGRLEPRPDGSIRLLLAGGGHLPPLVLRRSGEVESVRVGGTLVGVLPEAWFEMTETVLSPGDALYLYTDGVTEARDRDGHMYGDARLVRDLAGYAGAPPVAVVERLERLVLQHLRHGEHDDITILGVQAWPAGHRFAGERP